MPTSSASSQNKYYTLTAAAAAVKVADKAHNAAAAAVLAAHPSTKRTGLASRRRISIDSGLSGPGGLRGFSAYSGLSGVSANIGCRSELLRSSGSVTAAPGLGSGPGPYPVQPLQQQQLQQQPGGLAPGTGGTGHVAAVRSASGRAVAEAAVERSSSVTSDDRRSSSGGGGGSGVAAEGGGGDAEGRPRPRAQGPSRGESRDGADGITDGVAPMAPAAGLVGGPDRMSSNERLQPSFSDTPPAVAGFAPSGANTAASTSGDQKEIGQDNVPSSSSAAAAANSAGPSGAAVPLGRPPSTGYTSSGWGINGTGAGGEPSLGGGGRASAAAAALCAVTAARARIRESVLSHSRRGSSQTGGGGASAQTSIPPAQQGPAGMAGATTRLPPLAGGPRSRASLSEPPLSSSLDGAAAAAVASAPRRASMPPIEADWGGSERQGVGEDGAVRTAVAGSGGGGAERPPSSTAHWPSMDSFYFPAPDSLAEWVAQRLQASGHAVKPMALAGRASWPAGASGVGDGGGRAAVGGCGGSSWEGGDAGLRALLADRGQSRSSWFARPARW